MSLANLIRKRPDGYANANPAKAANDGRVRGEPLAGLAALALANPPETKALNQDRAPEAQQQRAASDAAAVMRREVTDPEEIEVVDWLARILEHDPVVYRETLAKCRTNPIYRAAFLNMARCEDAGTVQ